MLNSSDYPALEALAAIAEAGSFDRAAARLGLTTGAVSQRLRGLEDRLGTVLIDRGPPVRPTGTGARLVRHFGEVRALEAGLGLAPGRGQLKVAINADSLASWVIPALAQVPGVLFDIEIDDQDHSTDWLRRGTVSAAITSKAVPVRGCDVMPLGLMPYDVVATPDFVARWFPHGVTAQALRKAPALTYTRKDDLQRQWVRRQIGEAVAFRTHYLPSTDDITRAIEAGLGWGLNPSSTLAGAISDGRLIRLDGGALQVPLYWQAARLSAPVLAPLTQALKGAARDGLLPFAAGPDQEDA